MMDSLNSHLIGYCSDTQTFSFLLVRLKKNTTEKNCLENIQTNTPCLGGPANVDPVPETLFMLHIDGLFETPETLKSLLMVYVSKLSVHSYSLLWAQYAKFLWSLTTFWLQCKPVISPCTSHRQGKQNNPFYLVKFMLFPIFAKIVFTSSLFSFSFCKFSSCQSPSF